MSRRPSVSHIVAAVLLLLSVGTVIAFLWQPASQPAVSRSALLALDLSNVVYAWNPADPRPQCERERSLAEFVYEGYDSSAWIPQSVLNGNWMTRVILGDRYTIARDQIGLVPWPENKFAAAFGMAPNLAPDQALSQLVRQLPGLPHGGD